MRAFAHKQNQAQKPASSSLTPPNRATVEPAHREFSVLLLQRTAGNQAGQRLLRQAKRDDLDTHSSNEAVTHSGHDFSRIPPFRKSMERVQAKLTVSPAGAVYEQEADDVAEQVMRMPSPAQVGATSPSSMTSLVQRPVEGSGSGGGLEEAPPIVHEVLASPGRPLEAATRAFMEPRFGHDFSQVRIHSDARAAQSAVSINALAYTVGQSLVLGEGEYAPGTSKGDRLLAHELTHVVQQHPSGVSRFAATYGAPTMVYRQVGPGGGVSPGRIVYLDNDVLGEIADGSRPAAESLQKMRASGADVRITRYNYAEATHGDPMGAGARKLIVQELGITIDEGGGLASRQATYEELSAGKPVAVQPKDVPMIAAVKAAGPNAELWSFDGGVKENAARFGVRIAPESGKRGAKIPRVKTPDVRAGLNNVGLHGWDVTSDGIPIRRPVLPPAGAPLGKAKSRPKGGSAPKSEPLAPLSPAAETVSGEIGGSTRPGGGTFPGEGTPSPTSPMGVRTVPKVETKALVAEHKLVRWGGVAANPSRFARISTFLLERGIPDPTDVLFLFIDFFGSLAEARAKLRQDWYAIGFAQGMSARLLGFQADEAIKMLRWRKRVSAHGSVGEEVAGYAGIRQRATIEGGVAGYTFVRGLTDSERTAFFNQAANALKARKKTIGREKPGQPAVRRTHLGNVIIEEELDPSESAPESERYEFDLDDVLAFALALKPAVLELFEAAAEAAAAEQARQELEERSGPDFPQAF